MPRLAPFILALTICSCQTLYDQKSFTKAPAKGMISGQPWTYGYGYTDPEAKRAEGQEFMIVLTTGKPKHACPDKDDLLADAREVVIAIDGKIGEMKLKGNSGKLETEDDMFTFKKNDRISTVALSDPSQPESTQYRFATVGKVKITKLTKDVIEGAVIAKITKDNYVNGTFRAKLCAFGQLN